MLDWNQHAVFGLEMAERDLLDSCVGWIDQNFQPFFGLLGSHWAQIQC